MLAAQLELERQEGRGPPGAPRQDDPRDGQVRAHDVPRHEQGEPKDRAPVADDRRLRSQRGHRPCADRRHHHAEQELAGRHRLHEQQPHREEPEREGGVGQPAPYHRTGSAVWRFAPRTAFTYPCLSLSEWLVRPMWGMVGPATTTSARHTRRSEPTGMTSASRRAGCGLSDGSHNRSMPARVVAIGMARPEPISRPTNTQIGVSMFCWRLIRLWMIANFAMKPDSGGSPPSKSAQNANPPPRIAIVAGMTMPTSSSGASFPGRMPVYSSSKTGSTTAWMLVSASRRSTSSRIR